MDNMTAEHALLEARHKFDLCGASFEYEIIRQAITETRGRIERAHMAGQADAGVNPSYSSAKAYADKELSHD